MKASIIKNYADSDFPWEVRVQEQGKLVFHDYFPFRPSMKDLFRMLDEQDLRF